MIKREELTKIGKIKKTHGIKGEVLFEFTDDSFAEDKCDFLIFDLDGIFVPFRITDYRFISNTSALIQLKRIETGEDARTLVGKEVFYPAQHIIPDTSEELFSWDYFRGFTLIDEKLGKIGTITEIDDSTINILFHVEPDQSENQHIDSSEYLIPASDEFITHINPDQKELFVLLPEGLLEL
ncbi:ribosome maturation factor RimM [Bacteroidales bacterium OttesenSCG-928-A17]|nr:ribosome maturation factor RimM [Bacteroidales bacterium OttesenSCG-928-A17]